MAEESTPPRSPRGGAAFGTTHWSVIHAAAQEDRPGSMDALETLCRTYWMPLYAFVRRSGYATADAEDLTQAFFAHLLGSGFVKKVEVDKGKFRSFLLACLKNFMNSQWERARAQKRGGGLMPLSLEDCEIDIENSEDTPDTAYDKAWALTVLRQAMDLLSDQYRRDGREAIFEQLRPFLTGDKEPLSYNVVAERLGTSEGAVKMLVMRMRRAYRDCLKDVVLRTVTREDQVEEEFQNLLKALC